MGETDDRDTIVIEEERLRENYTRMPNTVLRRSDLSLGAKVVYMLLLSYAHQTNSCFPGQERLAEDLGGGARSVIRYLQELQDSGLLRVRRRGLGKTNIYVLAKWVAPRTAILADQETPRSAKMAVLEVPETTVPDVPNWQREKDSGEKKKKEKDLSHLRAILARRFKRRRDIDARLAALVDRPHLVRAVESALANLRPDEGWETFWTLVERNAG